MLLPAQLAHISVEQDWQHSAPYPPLGFNPFVEGALGNGDTYGLYWPIGREASEPIVVETWHDEWRLQPNFSSLAAFLRAHAAAGDAEDGDEEDEEGYVALPTLADDPASPRAAFLAARESIAQQNPAAAIALLEAALALLPEYTDALALLHGQYVRAGRTDEAVRVAIQSIISPPSFGGPPLKALQWLRTQPVPQNERDPIWHACGQLSFNFGGSKENADYPVLLAAIDTYLEQGNYRCASTLMQTYAELMSAETVSFQERHAFDPAAFIARQLAVSAALPQGSRDPARLWSNGLA
ncbi:tetratricopeptide repeat protein [Janthinobacterium violaceinigrum]|uniref:Tetratricopeptide repeat protein n=1 Tax=Janthinobacterium violaceinigrum TaxID=2654252 RepID=A0A6I1I268_9BURK|nr:tetratricopeptide repeat protein [Janthinobacterium violaceinigrum]KAB8065034.1 tetratricopeptide repeat protein [Janthinobacterium violaceinigrum]